MLARIPVNSNIEHASIQPACSIQIVHNSWLIAWKTKVQLKG